MNYERIAAGMQKRFADTVARYEGDFSLLQEEATVEIEQRDARIKELEAELAELKGRKEESSVETADSVTAES